MPKIVDHAQRRLEIIFALWTVIYEHGISGVTLQAVAAEAGVSVGRIQHYFSSKRDLVLAGAHAMLDASVMGWSDDADGDPDAALAALTRQPIPSSEEFRVGSAVWYAYLATATADPEVGAVVRDAVRDGFEAATRLITRLSGSGQAGSVTFDAAWIEAVRLVALGNGLAQAVFVGALAADEAVSVLDAELDRLRHGLSTSVPGQRSRSAE